MTTTQETEKIVLGCCAGACVLAFIAIAAGAFFAYQRWQSRMAE